jgi:hypothetical protein
MFCCWTCWIVSFFWTVKRTRGPYCLDVNCSTSYILHHLLGIFFISKRLIYHSNFYCVPFSHCYRRLSISLFPYHIIISVDSFFLLIECICVGLRLIEERNSYWVSFNHWYCCIATSLFHFTWSFLQISCILYRLYHCEKGNDIIVEDVQCSGTVLPSVFWKKISSNSVPSVFQWATISVLKTIEISKITHNCLLSNMLRFSLFSNFTVSCTDINF